MRFCLQGSKLQEQVAGLAQQHEDAAASLAASQEQLELLQRQLEEVKSLVQISSDAIVSDLETRLTESTRQVQTHKLAADVYQQQLQVSSALQLQQLQCQYDRLPSQGASESATTSQLSVQLTDAKMALQQVISRLATEAAYHEASQKAAGAQLKDYQTIIMSLLSAWASLMERLDVAWEHPIGQDIVSFQSSLQHAQHAALHLLRQPHEPAQARAQVRESNLVFLSYSIQTGIPSEAGGSMLHL